MLPLLWEVKRVRKNPSLNSAVSVVPVCGTSVLRPAAAGYDLARSEAEPSRAAAVLVTGDVQGNPVKQEIVLISRWHFRTRLVCCRDWHISNEMKN